jgi:transcriptional regulator with XRE-family HTH domain
MVNLARRIAEARRDAGLTQADLAATMGVSVAAVQTWEQGTFTPRPKRLHALAEALGKPVEWFVSEAPDAPGQSPPWHPGVEALLSDAAECARLQITQEDARRLRGLGDLGGVRVQTVEQAAGMLEQVRRLVPGDKLRDH